MAIHPFFLSPTFDDPSNINEKLRYSLLEAHEVRKKEHLPEAKATISNAPTKINERGTFVGRRSQSAVEESNV